MQAFVVKNGRPIDAIAYYSVISHPLHLVKGVLYVTQIILGDAIVVSLLRVYPTRVQPSIDIFGNPRYGDAMLY